MGKFGFKEAEKWLDSWNFSDLIRGLFGVIFDGVDLAVQWVDKLFTWPEGGGVLAGLSKLIDIIYWPVNIAVNLIKGMFGFGADEQGKIEPFSLGDLIVGAIESIMEFFAKMFNSIMNFDFKGFARSSAKKLGVPDTVLNWLGLGKKDVATTASVSDVEDMFPETSFGAMEKEATKNIDRRIKLARKKATFNLDFLLGQMGDRLTPTQLQHQNETIKKLNIKVRELEAKRATMLAELRGEGTGGRTELDIDARSSTSITTNSISLMPDSQILSHVRAGV